MQIMSVKIAIVGLGLIGRRHAQIIQGVDQAELSAIVDPDPQAQHIANDMGCAWFSSLLQMVTDHQPDGVILATPTQMHIEQCLICVDHGLPVLVEKPLCNATADAAQLLDLARARNIPILTGFHRRYNPKIQAAKTAIDQGHLGQLRAIATQCWFYKPDYYFDQAPWRKKSGAGPISVNLAHDIDLMRYLCGDVNTVYAMSTPALRGYENEDLATAVLRFENGAVGTISVSDSIASPWSWECTSGENSVYPKTDESCYRIGGSVGSLSVPDMTLWQHQGTPDWWTAFKTQHLAATDTDPLVLQIQHFADVIRGETEPQTSLVDSVRTTQIIEAVQRSCESGQIINVTPIS
jgi:predicted dehydrogenase